MSLWQLLTPKLIVTNPVWFLHPLWLKEQGLLGIVLDVDNTLLGNHEWEVSPTVRLWISQIKEEMQVWLVSNNCFHKRIQYVASSLDLPFYSNAAKPSRRCVRQALTAMELPPERVAMIGDRIFTDIMVGNRLGMFTVLIQPPAPIGATSRWVRNSEIWLARLSGASF